MTTNARGRLAYLLGGGGGSSSTMKAASEATHAQYRSSFARSDVAPPWVPNGPRTREGLGH